MVSQMILKLMNLIIMLQTITAINNKFLNYAEKVHTHKTNEVYEEYLEEEDYEEETVNENQEIVIEKKTKTITKTRNLDTILNNKSNVGHKHPISDITNLQTTLENKSNIDHNHNLLYSSIDHNHDSTYVSINNITNEITNTITNNTQLQELFRGKSAFEVWKENLLLKYGKILLIQFLELLKVMD